MINVIETGIPDLYVIEPKAFGDPRGWFMESWSKRDFEAAGLFYDWVQDNPAVAVAPPETTMTRSALSPSGNSSVSLSQSWMALDM